MRRKSWIKLWTQETLHGTTLSELLPEERAVWFEFLCLAGDSPIPGSICISKDIPYTDTQLSTLLAVTPELLNRAISKMERYGKIHRNGTGIIFITNFLKYQGQFDKTSYMLDYMRTRRGQLDKVKSNKDNSNQISRTEQNRTEHIYKKDHSRLNKGLGSKKRLSTNKSIYINIIYTWNSQNIIKFTQQEDDLKKYADKALKTYTEDQILKAIKTYGLIVNNKEKYYFNYKWSLKEFLSRSNAIVKFLDEEIAKQNFSNKTNKTKQAVIKTISVEEAIDNEND